MHPNIDKDRANCSELDLGGQEFKSNARVHLLEWSKQRPFYIFNNGPPMVVAGRYADVHEIFSDAERFASELPRGRGYEQYDKFMGVQFLTQMDGAQHARLRRLLMPAFSARRMEQMEGRIAGIIDAMLDEIERGPDGFDAMNDFAARLVVGALLTAMINLTPAQQQVAVDFQDVMPLTTTAKPGEPWPEVCQIAYRKMSGLVTDVIAERRRNPTEDFLGDIVMAHDQGDKLTDKELFDQIFGIFGALATTPRSASGLMYELYTHRDQLDDLQAHPHLIEDAVEEGLRIAGNGYFTFPRIATRDTEVGGTFIEKGMIVRPSIMSANYDADVFPDPMRFDIRRKPKRIMTFGAGPHHCIGNLLGRLTLRLAIGKFIQRFPKARLADETFVPVYGGAVGELRMRTMPMLRN
ncbi:MAG: cytochrome P450 [Hyphomicrobiales bacterium]|nr:cytochrome P450 [Hyphomicrobiales bacterium]